MNIILVKIIHGVAIGIGFCAVLFIYLSNMEPLRNYGEKLFGPDSFSTNDIDRHGLIINFHKQRLDTDEFTIVGTVRNEGKHTWKEVMIDAYLLEGDKKVDRNYTSDIPYNLKPGDEGFFKITFEDTPTKGVKYNYDLMIGYGVALGVPN